MADAHSKNHDYHIIDPSPWPLIGSIGALMMAIGGIAYMRSLGEGSGISMLGLDMSGPWLLLLGLLVVLYTMYAWWADTIKEAHAGDHTQVVSLHLRYGMIMFIASEVMFFVAWFWAFFDASLFANELQQVARVEYTGGTWPPTSIQVLDPLHLPLFNTVTLLLSGTTVKPSSDRSSEPVVQPAIRRSASSILTSSDYRLLLPPSAANKRPYATSSPRRQALLRK